MDPFTAGRLSPARGPAVEFQSLALAQTTVTAAAAGTEAGREVAVTASLSCRDSGLEARVAYCPAGGPGAAHHGIARIMALGLGWCPIMMMLGPTLS